MLCYGRTVHHHIRKEVPYAIHIISRIFIQREARSFSQKLYFKSHLLFAWVCDRACTERKNIFRWLLSCSNNRQF